MHLSPSTSDLRVPRTAQSSVPRGHQPTRSQTHGRLRCAALSVAPQVVLALLAILLSTPLVAHAQYGGPAGNTLPESAAPDTYDPSLPDAYGRGPDDPHAGHDHAPGEPHDHGAERAAPLTRAQHQAFADAVELAPFRTLSVFDNGRVKILDTLAREHLRSIYGKEKFRDTRADTLDNEPRDADSTKTRKPYNYDPVFTLLDLAFNGAWYNDKPLLHAEVLPLRRRLLAHLPEDEQERWLKLGRLTPAMFVSAPVQAVYRGADTSREEAKGRDQLFFAFQTWQTTAERLRLMAPVVGSVDWTHPDQQAPASGAGVAGVPELWPQLAAAWRAGEAESVNVLLRELAHQIPQINAQQYPPAYRGTLERIYNRTGKFSIGYVFYALATLLLLLAMATGRGALRTLGVAALLLGLGAHTASFAIRAVLSGRWAIHNQYESFIAISLFAVILGVVMMFAKRMLVFGTAAAALGTVSLLTANLWAIPSNEVGQVAGILATSRILYVHVNMVLVSYSLIGLSFFVSLAYLFAHYVPGRQLAAVASAGTAGGNTALPTTTPPATATAGRKRMLADLDKAQLTLMQLAFYLLGVGILLGAYWADHAWGRWWAWDPKETWALITWIVYLIAIHVRFGVRDRGLVTAWLSVIGFVVMLWTYWGVNLLLSGLHSYA